MPALLYLRSPTHIMTTVDEGDVYGRRVESSVRFAALLSSPCLRDAWLRQETIRAICVAGMCFAGGMARDSAVYRGRNGTLRFVSSICRMARPALSRLVEQMRGDSVVCRVFDTESFSCAAIARAALSDCTCVVTRLHTAPDNTESQVARGGKSSVPPRTLVSWGWGQRRR
jgi:hypothetical protein